jgi:hypothetical protein
MFHKLQTIYPIHKSPIIYKGKLYVDVKFHFILMTIKNEKPS